MIVKKFKVPLLSALPLLLLLALAVVLLPFGGGSSDAALIDEMIALEKLGSPLISSDFDVYLDQGQNRLIYTREECVAADLSALFFLHFIPVEVDDLPDYRQQYGFDSTGFRFDDYRLPQHARCVAAYDLPDYAITGIRTGQYVERDDGSYQNFWEAEYHFGRMEDPLGQTDGSMETPGEVAVVLEELGSPLISSDFDVYLDQGQNRLIYTREECVAADLSALFFLHFIPVEVDDLPDYRQQYGFDSTGFRFDDYRLPQHARCVAAYDLPDYAITGIRTGQYVERDDGSYQNFWEAEYHFGRMEDPLGQTDGSMETPGEVAVVLEELGSPLISSDFDVYLDQGQNRLIYTREECVAADLSALFFLHFIPVEVDDLPDYRQQYGFDSTGFRFDDYRLPQHARCVAAYDLPDYAITGIRTGQYVERDDGSYQNFWEAEYHFGRMEDPLGQTDGSMETPGEVAVVLEELGSPLISSDFDVYLDQGQNRLIYTREECVAADLSALFFLHFIPVEVDDLPDYRQQYGFDSTGFRFDDYRLPQHARCVAAYDLPDYAITGIRTGQYVERDDGSYQNFWEAEYHFGRMEDPLGQTDGSMETPGEVAVVLEELGSPLISSDFDVYLDQGQNRLIYTREECVAADLSALFFLHLIPVDMNDLPDHRKQYGFDNHDFNFEMHAWRRVEVCVAAVPLPEYDIATIRTGQYVQANGGFDNLWEGEIRLNE